MYVYIAASGADILAGLDHIETILNSPGDKATFPLYSLIPRLSRQLLHQQSLCVCVPYWGAGDKAAFPYAGLNWTNLPGWASQLTEIDFI